ncbi:MAG: hypothetical protein HY553_20050 [Elusimicrobia bacterium]|nr:hypothetical protein [Elusimicrobiota bacterium]
MSRLASRLSELLSAREVEQDVRLRMLLAALLFYMFSTFTSWYDRPGLCTAGTHTFNYVPVWLFEDARWLIFLSRFWAKTYFYGLFMSALLGLFWLFYRKDCLAPMLILAFLFVNKLFFYLSDLRLMANFHHIHLILTFAFLVSREKLFFFRLALLACYWLSGLTKLTPSWLWGEYFNSVPDKLPLLPRTPWVVTLLQQALIVVEFVAPALWFSKSRFARLASFGVLLLFHAYSGVIVGHKYPSLMLPVLIPAFLRFDGPIQEGYRFARRHVPSWAFLALLLLGGLLPFAIPGDVRLTAEGRYFGLFMFDANRAVSFRARIEKADKAVVFQIDRPWRDGAILDDGTLESGGRPRIGVEIYRGGRLEQRLDAETVVLDGQTILINPKLFELAAYRTNGDPYLYYFYGKQLCRSYRPDRLQLELWQQLDGHQERVKLMDIPDFCGLNPRYSAFRHNDWILLPGPDAPAFYRWW